VQLTKKASYGLIAVLELARTPPATPVPASAIAQRYSLPSPFVEKILHRLKQAGVVVSRKGRGGGYALASEPATVSVRSVLEALDESLHLVDCLDSEFACDVTDVCPTRRTWRTINLRFLGLLESLSLQDLLEE
jgi:Rrf2 family iron-sulfur cluster assembly transcriptional regulator